MTATLMPLTVQRFFDASGSPLAGGQVYTYAAGSTTPMASYTDQSALQVNSNPIILDSTGSASIWLSGSYKINVLDVNGVQQPNYPVDNVSDFHTIDNITATSTTSLSISTTTATRTFTTQSGKYYVAGSPVYIIANGATSNNMYGTVTSYIGNQLVVAIVSGNGTGTFANWTITLSGTPGPQGATGASGSGSGDMLGASNLAVGAGGVANAATARTNLGLGTSATHDTGTSAGNIPLLDGSARMPAVDGSQLTNITTIVLGTATSFNSATNYSITGLPSGIKKLTMNLQGVTVSSNSALLFQIGDAIGGLKTTGYQSASVDSGDTFTTGMGVFNGINTPTLMSGSIEFNLVDAANFIWVATHNFINFTNIRQASGAGQVTLAGALNTIKFTTLGGTATWTAGKINISYQ